ncbi:hypothetical protein B0A49_09087 [Cryomyces minteri]|uniref:Microbial-type PARG catalytic domain-containing protein n=1 Tax=Cryomyces minteri TaxID=331657 RepID=A0A4U0X0W3_9PEZI|nr:hypothetical protein B0A49_09087 [Cryomyces minteri]
MGRTQPTVAVQPQAFRKAERSKKARDTINKDIPALLRSSPRARRGVFDAELVVDPPANPPSVAGDSASSYSPYAPRIRLQNTDTLTAATYSARASNSAGKGKVAVLNMASPLRAGGGFLQGATSQEEFLCMRTTLYPSLRDEFYRLPQVGAVYTPDVLVFRSSAPEVTDLPKKDRFFIDVVSAGMLRLPELEGDPVKDADCTCGAVSYCDKDREIVLNKMKAVMRILQAKGAEKIVLGAWGCGAYENPVTEVAKAWKKVIVGTKKDQRRGRETWHGIKEVVFAINDRTLLREFEKTFEGHLEPELEPAEDWQKLEAEDSVDRDTEELEARIADMEEQIAQVKNADLKARLELVLAGLKTQLDASQPPSSSEGEEELGGANDDTNYVQAGYYDIDEDDADFDPMSYSCSSSDSGDSNDYEFRSPGEDVDTDREIDFDDDATHATSYKDDESVAESMKDLALLVAQKTHSEPQDIGPALSAADSSFSDRDLKDPRLRKYLKDYQGNFDFVN